MSTVRYIVWKDFQFLRGRLAVWLAGLAGKFAIGFGVLAAEDLSDQALTHLLGGVGSLVVFDAALTLLLAALLVQEDGVAGTTAFWRTRPISGARLLAAKLVGAGLFLLLPALLLSVPWWLWCGLSGAQMAAAAIEVLLFQGGLILVAFAAASLTNSIGRCLVWGITGFGAAYGVAGIWTWMTWWPRGPAVPEGMAFLLVLLLVPLLAGVVVWQYLTRRTVAGIAILATGVLLAPPATAWLAPALAMPRRGPAPMARDERQDLSRGIEVSWQAVRIFKGRTNTAHLEFSYEVRGVPPGFLVTGRQSNQTVRTSAGEQVAVRQNGVGGENQGSMAVRLAREASRSEAAAEATRTIVVKSWLSVAPADLEKLRRGPAEFSVDLRLMLVRPQILGPRPAADDSWQAQAGHGWRVMKLEQTDSETVASVIESEPMGIVAAIWHDWRGSWMQRNTLYVVERKNGGSASLTGRSLASLALGGVQLRKRTLALGREAEGATLSLVNLAGGVQFSREVRVPQMTIP